MESWLIQWERECGSCNCDQIWCGSKCSHLACIILNLKFKLKSSQQVRAQAAQEQQQQAGADDAAATTAATVFATATTVFPTIKQHPTIKQQQLPADVIHAVFHVDARLEIPSFWCLKSLRRFCNFIALLILDNFLYLVYISSDSYPY